MAKTTYATVDEYMNALEAAAREVLEQVREALREAVPVDLMGRMARFQARLNQQAAAKSR